MTVTYCAHNKGVISYYTRKHCTEARCKVLCHRVSVCAYAVMYVLKCMEISLCGDKGSVSFLQVTELPAQVESIWIAGTRYTTYTACTLSLVVIPHADA